MNRRLLFGFVAVLILVCVVLAVVRWQQQNVQRTAILSTSTQAIKYGVISSDDAYRLGVLEKSLNVQRSISDADLDWVTNLVNTPRPRDTAGNRELLQWRVLWDLAALRPVTPRQAQILYNGFKPDLLSSDDDLKISAIKLFGKSKVLEAEPDLQRLLSDPDVDVRTAAKRGLERLQPTRSD